MDRNNTKEEKGISYVRGSFWELDLVAVHLG